MEEDVLVPRVTVIQVEPPSTSDECLVLLRNLKNNKCPGEYGIT